MNICEHCKKKFRPHNDSRGRFCGNQCQQDLAFNDRYRQWLQGIVPNNISPRGLKRLVVHRDSYKCASCDLEEWLGKPLALELEHIGGDSGDNRPDNLCLLCPNCHSQTPTYKTRNIGKGRYARRKRYAEGKSY